MALPCRVLDVMTAERAQARSAVLSCHPDPDRPGAAYSTSSPAASTTALEDA